MRNSKWKKTEKQNWASNKKEKRKKERKKRQIKRKKEIVFEISSRGESIASIWTRNHVASCVCLSPYTSGSTAWHMSWWPIYIYIYIYIIVCVKVWVRVCVCVCVCVCVFSSKWLLLIISWNVYIYIYINCSVKTQQIKWKFRTSLFAFQWALISL